MNKRSDVISLPTLKTDWYVDLIIKHTIIKTDVIGCNSIIKKNNGDGPTF